MCARVFVCDTCMYVCVFMCVYVHVCLCVFVCVCVHVRETMQEGREREVIVKL